MASSAKATDPAIHYKCITRAVAGVQHNPFAPASGWYPHMCDTARWLCLVENRSVGMPSENYDRQPDTPRADADAHHYRDSITDTVLSPEMET